MLETGQIIYKSSIEELVEKEHTRAMGVAEKSAMELAQINKPRSSEPLDGFTGSITAIYRSLASKVASLSGAENAHQKSQTLQKRYADREVELRDQIDELSIRGTRMKSELDAFDIEKVKVRERTWKYFVAPLIVCLLLGESILNQESLSLLNSSGFVFRLLLAFSLSGVLFLLIWGMVHIWHRAVNSFVKWSSMIGGVVLVGVSMYALSQMRIDYLNSLPNSRTEVSPLLMTSINLLFFLASLLGKLHFSLTPEEKAKRKKFDRLESEYKDLENTLLPLQSELEKLPKNRDEELEECQSIIVMAQYYQDHIAQLHHQALAHFHQVSNVNRSDGKTISFSNYVQTPTLSTYSFTPKNN